MRVAITVGLMVVGAYFGYALGFMVGSVEIADRIIVPLEQCINLINNQGVKHDN